jgi:hypothetical protein
MAQFFGFFVPCVEVREGAEENGLTMEKGRRSGNLKSQTISNNLKPEA